MPVIDAAYSLSADMLVAVPGDPPCGPGDLAVLKAACEGACEMSPTEARWQELQASEIVGAVDRAQVAALDVGGATPAIIYVLGMLRFALRPVVLIASHPPGEFPELPELAHATLVEPPYEGPAPELVEAIASMIGLGPAEPSEAILAEVEADLNSGGVRDRRQASAALAAWPHPRCLPLLSRCLQDTDVSVRQNAAGALAEIGTPEALRVLWEFRDDPDHTVRLTVVSFAAAAHWPESRELLIGAVRDESEDIRLAAVEALGHVAEKTDLSALKAARQDAEESVRQAAAQALYKTRVRLKKTRRQARARE